MGGGGVGEREPALAIKLTICLPYAPYLLWFFSAYTVEKNHNILIGAVPKRGGNWSDKGCARRPGAGLIALPKLRARV
jgi:hypothetical protein